MSENKIYFSRFTELKNRINTETGSSRRGNSDSYGSLSDYSKNYNYSDTSGLSILEEHFEKIIIPLRAINSSGMPSEEAKNKKILEEDFLTMESKLSTFENISKTSSGHGCSGKCTGLCSSECYIACSGCSGTCSATCASWCKNGCDNTCSSCGSGCGTTCQQDTCTATCGGCTDTCWPNCSGACHIDKCTVTFG